jgi:hypothetical protein
MEEAQLPPDDDDNVDDVLGAAWPVTVEHAELDDICFRRSPAACATRAGFCAWPGAPVPGRLSAARGGV